MYKQILAALVGCLATTALLAAEPAAPAKPAPKAAAPAAAPAPLATRGPVAPPSAAQLAAAQELLLAMGLDKSFDEMAAKAADMQIRQMPMLASSRQTMLDFFRKYMSWDSIKDDMARVYAENFTESELKELTAFYQTPIGKKLAQRLPELTSRGSEVAMQRVQAHMPELQQAIAQEMQKSRANAGAGALPPGAPVPPGTRKQ